MTQKELAELIGVTDKSISKWERASIYQIAH
ncbi:helix-turn-helix domain-containing protein [Clostridium sp. AUH-JLR23]